MTTINGLPAHILLIHAVVVLIPLTALLTVLVAVWPAARDRLVWPMAVIAAATVVTVPLTVDAGDWLEHRVPATDLVRTHTALGESLPPWSTGLAVVAAVLLARYLLTGRRSGRHVPAREVATPRPLGGPAVTVALAVLTVAVAAGSLVMIYKIGDSGARAAWTGQFTAAASAR